MCAHDIATEPIRIAVCNFQVVCVILSHTKLHWTNSKSMFVFAAFCWHLYQYVVDCCYVLAHPRIAHIDRWSFPYPVVALLSFVALSDRTIRLTSLFANSFITGEWCDDVNGCLPIACWTMGSVDVYNTNVAAQSLLRDAQSKRRRRCCCVDQRFCL